MNNLLKNNRFFYSLLLVVTLAIILLPAKLEANFSYDANIFASTETKEMAPFGANLFQGQFSADQDSGINPNYQIQQGDNINVSLWGDVTFTEVLTVDTQGNIFIPQVGPIKILGSKNSNLTSVVSSAVKKVFPSGVEVYTNLSDTKPISVFVTGAVNKPGRYNGVATDSLLHYLDKASGVDYEKGSFRKVNVIRKNVVIETFDIYQFLLQGKVPSVQLNNNDIILVDPKGLTINVDGSVKNRNIFEFQKSYAFGYELMELAKPDVGSTNVSVSGYRESEPISAYMSVSEFRKFDLRDGDSVLFHSSAKAEEIKVFVDGEYIFPGVVVAPVGSSLKEVLSQIEVDPYLSNYRSVKIERTAVAEQQKIALANSLRRLEESVFVAQSYTAEEQKQRGEEAKLISAFIENAKTVSPKGTVVVSNNGVVEDIQLQDGDRIVIPKKTNIVLVTGEVTIPSAVVYKDNMGMRDYIKKAGGLSVRADDDRIILIKANGAAIPADEAVIQPGDEIIVLPEIKVDRISVARNVADLLYKLVLSVAVPVKLFDD